MNEFTAEYVQMFKRWSDFNGKSNTRELWMAVLVNFLIGIVFTILGRIIGIFNTIEAIYGLVILIPMIALWIRRMHDVGKSGWNLLWWLLPVVGWIYVVYLAIQPSK